MELPRETIWQAMQDPNILATILPNCESLQLIEEDKYSANFSIDIGPISGNFKSDLQVVEKKFPDYYSFVVNGTSAIGGMNGMGTIRLSEAEKNTVINLAVEANVTGIIARIGQRLIDATAKKLVEQGFESFKNKLFEFQLSQT